jgi:hypothetical protein
MTTKRFYSGAREGASRVGPAAQMKRLEIMKGGKLPMTNGQRYKMIFKRKMAEHMQQAQAGRAGFSLPGTVNQKAALSTRTMQLLEDRAKRKAAKEERALRQMVVIKPRNYGGVGYIDKKGKVYDVAGNIVLGVNTKNGKISTYQTGWYIGKYRPKGMGHNQMMTDAILKHSPYYIKLRQMQLQQHNDMMYGQSGVYNGVHGGPTVSIVDVHGRDISGDELNIQNNRRSNISVGVYGTVSNNVHGTFGDTIHGTFSDNVWGGSTRNIWGGFMNANATSWDKPGRAIWNTGTPGQSRQLKRAVWFLAGLFGVAGNSRRAAARALGGAGVGRR